MLRGFKLFVAYERALHAHPLATKATTSAAIGCAGDLFAQHLQGRKSVNWKRVATFAFLGGVMVAPALHLWYGTLDRLVPGTTFGAVGTRLLLDQVVFAPIFIPTFMTMLMALEGQPNPLEEARHQWRAAVFANWKLWVPAQLVNFNFVPVHRQVLFANCVACVWNVYLSYATHQ